MRETGRAITEVSGVNESVKRRRATLRVARPMLQSSFVSAS